jgi:hypothetical protein
MTEKEKKDSSAAAASGMTEKEKRDSSATAASE